MPLQVLIIDDDLSFKRLLELRLKSFIAELSVTHFPALTPARTFLDGEHPHFDLVILDEHLPDGRGVELLNEGRFKDIAVLSVSSDDDPAIPGASMQAGAAYFLSKVSVTEPLFKPLVKGIIDRNQIQRQLAEARIKAAINDTVKTLVATLRHEINNPLGAVLGATYLLRNLPVGSAEQRDAADLVEASGKRIKHVLDQLCTAVEVEPVTKAAHKVFHIPGDSRWDEPEGKK
jgi:DNA-binding NarL/FixJ family response regulator